MSDRTAPDPASLVSLRVNGARYEGWKSVSITAGIDRIARDFTLSVTDRWPGTDLQRRVVPGDRCEVFIGNDKVLTGWVDATPISYDKASVTVSVRGRSLTGDLVDCAAIHAAGQWTSQKVERIAQVLAQPYGVTVRADVDTGAAITDHQLQPGESVMENVDRMLKQRRLLATDDGNGALVFIKPGALKASTALRCGGDDANVLTGSCELDEKGRFSEYVCLGQQALSDIHGSDGSVSSQSASAKDSGVKRYRRKVMQLSGQGNEGTCRQRVDFERDTSAAKPFAATYAVQGWRQGSGVLWLPNMLVRVVDPIIGFDMDMLISEVTWSLTNEGGMTTSLRVAPPKAYLQPAATTGPAGAGGGGQWGDVKAATPQPGPRPQK